MDEVKERKKAWRRLIVEIFRLVPREERRRLDEVLSDKTYEYVKGGKAGLLLGFAPMLDEPDLSIFYRRWLAGGGGFALPVWLGGDRMLIRRVRTLDDELRPGRGGIMEPLDTLPEVRPEEIDLVIVPGRAFSESCARMGRGSGCYDSLLREYGMAKFGVAYDFQVFPEIATEPKDVPLDFILTPSRVVGRSKGNGVLRRLDAI